MPVDVSTTCKGFEPSAAIVNRVRRLARELEDRCPHIDYVWTYVERIPPRDGDDEEFRARVLAGVPFQPGAAVERFELRAESEQAVAAIESAFERLRGMLSKALQRRPGGRDVQDSGPGVRPGGNRAAGS
jgi:hypothetical protein